MSNASTALQVFASGIASGIGYGLVEAQLFTTREVFVQSSSVGETPLRILHLSDLHITPSQTRKINWVRSLGELKPDLTVVTGDFLAHQLAVPAVIEALDVLLDGPGLFVFGSNDYHAPEIKNPFRYFNKNRKINPQGKQLPTNELAEQLTDAGWVDLNNHQRRFTVSDTSIHARGTNDAHIKLDDYASVSGSYDSSSFALGVTHAPYSRVTHAFAQDGTDLLLAGHTHGGQVCVPFYGALVTNCDLPTSQAKGLSTVKADEYSMPMHVSAGVGTSPITPVRFACRPEATVITVARP